MTKPCRVLLLIPPMTQLNTPYPATAYLSGFLRTQGREAQQADLALELALKIFSRSGLERVVAVLKKTKKHAPAAKHFLANKDRYLDTIDAAVRFLQGNDETLALRIVGGEFFPEGSHFAAIDQMAEMDPNTSDPLNWAFGSLGAHDRAKYLASLMITDLATVIREGVDARFELARFGEKLAASQASFEPMLKALKSKPTLIDEMLFELVDEQIAKHKPDFVGLTAPFPGNVYGAFRIGQRVKQKYSKIKVALGGGFANTELRTLSEPKVFDFIDYITLDDGERPILNLLEHIEGSRALENLLRVYMRENGKVVFRTDSKEHDIPHKSTGAPSYAGLDLKRYLTIFEMLNPMHRLWSDGRWNKLTLAHGCYWKKCTFCDVGLDYIGRYETAAADLLVDRIETVMRETGSSGFHFVDEAAPPAVLKALAERLIARKVVITWWGNIRFEKAFTPELAKLLAKSGCVAISGGLEVAADRLLKLMQKGVTVEQTAQVTHALTAAGIMVHAYLMYGFPTQTLQETIDSLERVRQLFQEGCIQSAFWHRFAATAHSPIGLNPKAFRIKILPVAKVTFAHNDLSFIDPVGCDHDALSAGLNKALYNYMHGLGFEIEVMEWFRSVKATKSVKRTTVPPDLIIQALKIGH